jgi:dolichol-phosphate mannosyltransferase
MAAEYEIVVVDDGSRDGTGDLAEAEARRNPRVRVLRHEQTRGYGAALRSGFEAARYDLVTFTDADCQFDLRELVRGRGTLYSAGGVFLAHLDDASAELVAFGIEACLEHPLAQLFGADRLAARLLVGNPLQDIDCALKVFRRESLRRILPESTGFFVNTEMLTRARQQGLSVVEVGVHHRPRAGGYSKVSLRYIPRTLGVGLALLVVAAVVPARGDGARSPRRRILDPSSADRPGRERPLVPAPVVPVRRAG